MALALTVVLASVVTLLTAFWVYFSWHFDYWKKRGVPQISPLYTTINGFRQKVPFWEQLAPAYQQFKANRFGGCFQARRPVLIVCDPDLIKLVLTKEFSNFHDRGLPFDEENDPLSANLFSLEGTRWKNLRTKLSPTFTSGKMKLMFHLMTDISNELNDLVRGLAAKKQEVEWKGVMTRYATDIIGSCAFGITCNSLKDPNSEFHQMGREFSNNNLAFIIRFFLVAIHPSLAKLLPFKRMFEKNNRFFLGLMKETVDFREKNKIERNDFVNLMMQLREADKKETDRANNIEFNLNQMTAQAFLFFIAGLDSIANNVCFCLHELALDPRMQRRAAAQVRQVLRKPEHGGSLTYQALKEMDLVEKIVREGLRKYCPVGFLSRVSNNRFKIPESDVELDTLPYMWIPVWQIQHDPEFYPDPDRFDPERFSEEAKEARHPYTYLPFGEGPRVCIAERFAMLEMKLCLATLLRDFHFSPGEKTETVIQMNPKLFSPTAKNGFWLNVEERSRDADGAED